MGQSEYIPVYQTITTKTQINPHPLSKWKAMYLRQIKKERHKGRSQTLKHKAL